MSEAMAFAMLEVGRADLARTLIEPIGTDAGFVDDYTTLMGASAALHVRVELDDDAEAVEAAALLEPFADRWAGAGTSPLSMGPVSLALARHRAGLGDDGRAGPLFAASVAASEANGAVAWLARTLVHQASFLAGTGAGDAGRAARDRAGSLAQRYGLPYVQRRLDADRGAVGGAAGG